MYIKKTITMKSLSQYLKESINENLDAEAARAALEKAIPGFDAEYNRLKDTIRSSFESEFKSFHKNLKLTWGEDWMDWGPKLLVIESPIDESKLSKEQIRELTSAASGYNVGKNGRDVSVALEWRGLNWFLPALGGKNTAQFLNKYDMKSVEECVSAFNAFASKVDSVCGTKLTPIVSSEDFKKSVAMIYARAACINKNGRIPKDISKFLS